MTEVALSHLEQHQVLIQEIQAIRVERGFNARSELILGKYEIGRAVITSPLYERNKKGVGDFVRKIGEDVGLAWRSIYDCCKFYNEAEAAGGLSAFFDQHRIGKEVTWSLVLGLLPKTKKEKDEDEEKKELRPYPTERSDRASACRYARRRLGKEWRQEDQSRMLELLGLYQI